jgi:hypothetical protein
MLQSKNQPIKDDIDIIQEHVDDLASKINVFRLDRDNQKLMNDLYGDIIIKPEQHDLIEETKEMMKESYQEARPIDLMEIYDSGELVLKGS